MNTKNIILVVLVLLVVVFAGLSCYLYLGVNKCREIATDLGGKLQQCASGVEQCTAGAKTCQEALTGLQQVCGPCLPQQ